MSHFCEKYWELLPLTSLPAFFCKHDSLCFCVHIWNCVITCPRYPGKPEKAMEWARCIGRSLGCFCQFLFHGMLHVFGIVWIWTCKNINMGWPDILEISGKVTSLWGSIRQFSSCWCKCLTAVHCHCHVTLCAYVHIKTGWPFLRISRKTRVTPWVSQIYWRVWKSRRLWNKSEKYWKIVVIGKVREKFRSRGLTNELREWSPWRKKPV